MPNLVASSEDVRIYECAVLYPYPVTQKEEQQIQKAIEGIFEEAGGKQVSKDAWGRRGLAYTIEGYNEGCFIIYYYEINPRKLKEVDEALRILPGVLRHMFVKPPKDYVVVKYSEAYETWLKERVGTQEQAKKKKEDELKEKVVLRAKREVKKMETAKSEDKKEHKTVTKAELSDKLEELISDDDLDI